MKLVGSREESIPPSTWTESGRTTILKESSSSRLAPTWDRVTAPTVGASFRLQIGHVRPQGDAAEEISISEPRRPSSPWWPRRDADDIPHLQAHWPVPAGGPRIWRGLV